jgi:hypothetical protein
MVKKSTRDEEKKPAPKPRASAVELIELRFGFFLNADQIVSVRVLPQQGDETLCGDAAFERRQAQSHS